MTRKGRDANGPESDRQGFLVGDGFRDFVSPHWTAMAHFARRSAPGPDWEDILQEALTVAWRKRRQFDPSRGSARTWLLSIVADRAYKSRRQKQLRIVPFNVDADIAEESPASDPHLAMDMQNALLRLTPRQRQAVILRYYLHCQSQRPRL